MCIFSVYKYYYKYCDRTLISVNYEVFSQNIKYNMTGTGSSTTAQCESVKSIFVQTILLNIHKDSDTQILHNEIFMMMDALNVE